MTALVPNVSPLLHSSSLCSRTLHSPTLYSVTRPPATPFTKRSGVPSGAQPRDPCRRKPPVAQIAIARIIRRGFCGPRRIFMPALRDLGAVEGPNRTWLERYPAKVPAHLDYPDQPLG